MADISTYFTLITSEHRDAPKFAFVLSTILQPIADNTELVRSMYEKFDIDTAVGAQLDVVGLWVGKSRDVGIANAYFSLDVAGLGLDEGYLKGPFDPDAYLTRLDDDHYRLVLKAGVLNNVWNGSIEDAYAIWDILFGSNFRVLIQDTGQMSMYQAIQRISDVPFDAVTLGLFSQGKISVRPAGVDLQYIIVQQPDQTGLPLFGLDVENDSVAGLDVGSFGLEFRV